MMSLQKLFMMLINGILKINIMKEKDKIIGHITPIDDLKEHSESRNCKCNPKVEENAYGYLVIHNSFDGREAVEIANEILNK